MQRSEISKRILAFLREKHSREGLALTEETDLLKEWFLDSLAVVETVVFLEQDFGLSLNSADISAATFQNVKTLTDFVAERL
jgi:acyl carrier protein